MAPTNRSILFLFYFALLFYLPLLGRSDSYGPNLIPAGNFEAVTPTYVPWAGVDAQGNIHGLDGQQIAVGDDGSIRGYKFGPSVAVGDLNGDGKPDLVMADSTGFFWYFPNSGTPQKPAFTQGEVIPIWLGEERVQSVTEGVDNVVPRIQLIDFHGNKRLDITAGTYAGKLFLIPNIGSDSQPVYKPTYNRDSLLINTRRKGALWCNYLAPCFTSLFGDSPASGSRDLIMGEGTYSANSIYLLHNTGSRESASFDEDHCEKIIPGMGLEQLTPLVIDWNQDGKPDILTGDRTGYLTLFLNTSSDPEHPSFAPGQKLSLGATNRFGAAVTVTVGDLTGNGLPNLIIGRNDGTLLYALNTGTLGAPAFTTPPTPLKGILPPNYHYVSPNLWRKTGAWGAPYELLSCVNPQLEPGFAFPPGVPSKYALKFSVWPFKSTYFADRYYPPIEDDLREHVIICLPKPTLKLNTSYRLHFWARTADRNVSNLRYRLIPAVMDRDATRPRDVVAQINPGSTWAEISTDFKLDSSDKSITTWPYAFEFRFTGQATFYIDDLQLKEKL